MSIIEKAVAWALDIAADPSRGYDQSNRWGPNYDCSSLVISAWEQAGLPVKSKGATYTGNMRVAFIACGFMDATELVNRATGGGLEYGDVLLNVRNHTAMYIGNGQLVHASINEKGTIVGGASGDQTGREICTRSYYNYPWDYILRYKEDDYEEVPEPSLEKTPIKNPCVVELPLLYNGSVGGAVLALQNILIHKWAISCGPDGADGDFGPNTEKAVMVFQNKFRLAADGKVGTETWPTLIGK